MPRKILVTGVGEESMQFVEGPADNEAELQKVLLDHPQLLPAEDFGLDDDLLVAGRETTLASGSVDLLCLSRTGEIVIIEFKTGPQNPDFRHALAQVVDYGSDLWKLSGWTQFDEGVVHRHLASRHAHASREGARDLRDAARDFWNITDAEWQALTSRIDKVLETGDFHFVVSAQRFTDSMKDSVRFLNETTRYGRYFLVELIRLDGGGRRAFAAQVVEGPSSRSSAKGAAVAKVNEADFLDAIGDPNYRESMSELFATASSLGLEVKWYTKGASIRLKSPDRKDPLSIGWVFLEDGQWYGARHATFGVDDASLNLHASLGTVVRRFCEQISKVDGGKPTPSSLRATTFEPGVFPRVRTDIFRTLAELTKEAAG